MAGTQGFASSVYPLQAFGMTLPGYAALYSVLLNFALAIGLTPFFNRPAQPTDR
jgi:SSS family solute:Na+ symporter